MTKYSLTICELFNKTVHGKTENSANDIETHLMVYTTIDLEDFYNMNYYDDLCHIKKCYKLLKKNNNISESTLFPNYYNLVMHFVSNLEIVQQIELPTQEHIAIIKTFWLKLFQRKVKRYIKNKKIAHEPIYAIHFYVDGADTPQIIDVLPFEKLAQQNALGFVISEYLMSQELCSNFSEILDEKFNIGLRIDYDDKNSKFIVNLIDNIDELITIKNMLPNNNKEITLVDVANSWLNIAPNDTRIEVVKFYNLEN